MECGRKKLSAKIDGETVRREDGETVRHPLNPDPIKNLPVAGVTGCA